MSDIELSEEEKSRFEERVAICIVDGDLSEEQAKNIAVQEILSARKLSTQSVQPIKISEIKLITGEELLHKELPPVFWVIPNFLSEGLSILASRPKLGKSFLCLNIALSIAIGETVIGKFPISPQKILYLSFEDTARSIKDRINKINPSINPNKIPLNNLILPDMHSFPILDENGLKILSEIIDTEKIQLVIIDTLARAMEISSRVISYYSDYKIISHLREFALDKKICLLVVSHTRKKRNDSYYDIDEFQGTTGITAGADTLLHLKKEGGSYVLNIIGKNVMTEDLNLIFDYNTFIWTTTNVPSFGSLTPEREEILSLLRIEKKPMKLNEIAEKLGKSTSNIAMMLKKLIDEGIVEKPKTGFYSIKELSIENT